MKEFVISETKTETAVLVALITPQQDEAKTKEYLDELEFLAETAGARTVRRFTQRANGPSQVSYVGSGKLQEIRQYIKNCQDAYDEWLKAEGEGGRENTSANKNVNKGNVNNSVDNESGFDPTNSGDDRIDFDGSGPDGKTTTSTSSPSSKKLPFSYQPLQQ